MLTEREVLEAGGNVSAPGFPRPIQYGPNGTMWDETPVRAWLSARKRKARKTQTRPAPGGETRPAE